MVAIQVEEHLAACFVVELKDLSKEALVQVWQLKHCTIVAIVRVVADTNLGLEFAVEHTSSKDSP